MADNNNNYERWQLPTMDDEESGGENSFGYMTASKLAALQENAYKEAYDKGYSEGFNQGQEAGKADITSKIQLFDQVLTVLDSPLQDLDQQVEQDLVFLSITIARQLIKREIKNDPGEIVGVVRECMALLPSASRDIRITMHPDDAVLIKELLPVSTRGVTWEIDQDPTIARGGCIVNTNNSRIDASIENRLTAITAKILGGVRENDEAAAP